MAHKIAFLFPGQGAQSVGMCKSLYENSGVFKQTIEEIEDLAYQKIWQVISEGPEKELTKTDHCQLALFAVSLATFRAVRFERPHLVPSYCAGMSLGEYTALCAAGVLSLQESVNLVLRRAQLMQESCEKYPGKMTAVLGLSIDVIESIVSEYPDKEALAVANYNAPQQIVVAGTPSAIEWFESKAGAKGARRLVRLDVAGAFHSPLMKEAMETYKAYVDTAKLEFSEIKVASNVTGTVIEYSEDFRELMTQQICSPVRWCPTIANLESQGVKLFIELGPGKILQGLNRRMAQSSQTLSIETIEDFTALL
jgi:[acyl-carrier-protein] S-malonyltransferase